MTVRFLQAFLVASVGLATSSAFAIETWFLNTTGNREWDDPANWNNGVPTADDFALIGSPAEIPANEVRVVDTLNMFGSGSSPILQGGRVLVNLIESSGGIGSDVTARDAYLRLNGPQIYGVIGDGAGGGGFGVIGWGTLRESNTYTGPTVVYGPLTIRHDGAIPNTSAVHLAYSEFRIHTLVSSADRDRLPDSADVRMRRGTFTFINSGPGVEQFRDLVIDAGVSNLTAYPNAASPKLVARRLVANPGAALIFNDVAPTTQTFRLLDPPQLPSPGAPAQTPILAYAAAGDGDVPYEFVTYDYGANRDDPADDAGFRTLRSDEYVRNSFASQANVWIDLGSTSTVTLATDATIQSLLLGGYLQITGNSRLTIEGNAILGGIVKPSTGSIRFPGNGYLYDMREVDARIEAQTLTIVGSAFLNRQNLIPGGLFVAKGTVAAGAAGALGTGPLTLAADTHARFAESDTIASLALDAGFQEGPLTILKDVYILSDSASTPVQLTIAGPISGIGRVVQNGPAIHYTGAGSVQHVEWTAYDDFRLDGTLGRNTGGVLKFTVGFGSTFSGTGVLGGTLDVIGTVSPGPGTARLDVEQLMMGTGVGGGAAAIFQADLNGTTAESTYDQIAVAEATRIDRGRLVVSFGYVPTIGDKFTIIDNLFAGDMSGTFLDLPQAATFSVDANLLQITYFGGDGNDVVLTVVPEPGMMAVSALLLALGCRSTRRR